MHKKCILRKRTKLQLLTILQDLASCPKNVIPSCYLSKNMWITYLFFPSLARKKDYSLNEYRSCFLQTERVCKYPFGKYVKHTNYEYHEHSLNIFSILSTENCTIYTTKNAVKSNKDESWVFFVDFMQKIFAVAIECYLKRVFFVQI